MNIAILDAYPLDFDGLPWSQLEALGAVTRHDQTADDEVIARCANANAVITNKVVFSANVIPALPALRYIGITATGTNNVDLSAAAFHDIAVTNVPGYSTESVVQYVFAHLFDCLSKVAEYSAAVKNGAWSTSAYFCLHRSPIIEAAGKTLGIVGCGAIGLRVAEVAHMLGMRVIKAGFPGRSYREPRVPIDEVFRESDVLTLHCPLTPETEELVNERMLASMKREAILINTARGPLVDEQALADALHAGRLGWACLDVLSTEPPDPTNPLLDCPRTTITPHVAWATREARERLVHETSMNLKAFLDGEIRNRVEQK